MRALSLLQLRELGSARYINTITDILIGLADVVETAQRPTNVVDHIVQSHRGCPEEISGLQRTRACPGLRLGGELSLIHI